ncbi:MAG: hypothetical protein HYR94_04075 [Chloroflexi bacterium]|nr:hypothetical protein [Chloroflexota bacterium]
MFNSYMSQRIMPAQMQGRSNAEARTILEARQLYQQAAAWRWRALVWALLTGRSRRLLNLAEVEARSQIVSRHFAGLQTVPVRQIRGSASKGRGQDFDIDFYPRLAHDTERWKSVAAAWLYGQSWPPIELIQVGETYFVRDGHHRVSIARTLGQRYMDAMVTVWQVAEPLTEAQHAAPSPQPGECLMPA